MPDPLLEDVFKLSGSPTYTFVRPLEYAKLLVALRTPRGYVYNCFAERGLSYAHLDEVRVQAV